MPSLQPHSHSNKIKRLRRLSHLLDNAIAIPGIGYRVGLDPLLGLLPGGGDTVTGALGAYIIVEAARMGIPRQVIWQMVGNIIFDSVLGTVPVIGDIFDVGWKANVRNMTLLEKHLDYDRDNRKSDWLFLTGLVLLLIIIIVGFATFTVLVVRWLWQLLSQ